MWLTAGWLNFPKMYWNWVDLDEKDIRTAIEMQYKEKIIGKKKMKKMNDYINKIAEIDKNSKKQLPQGINELKIK
jgi:asparagine synthetase B (glutamine-hydrolysing)